MSTLSWNDQPRPSLREVARARPLRFLVGETFRYASAMALANLTIESLWGQPLHDPNPWRLAIVLSAGLLIALVVRKAALGGSPPGRTNRPLT